MKSVSSLSDELISQMIENIGEKQYKLLEGYKVSEYNKLFMELESIIEELKKRPGDRRIVLKGHYGHPNIQVRLNAATHTLVVAPDEARALLQAIADTKHYPQAAEAGLRLDHLATGFYKPT
jgi:hypothetical protein